MTDEIAFIDSNILIYHLVQPDHPHSPPSTALLAITVLARNEPISPAR